MSRAADPDRPFQVAFVVALVFHLSALTLFSIVVRFNRVEAPFSTLSLVDSRTLGGRPRDAVPTGPADLTISVLAPAPRLDTGISLWPTLEKINPPSLTAPLRLRNWERQFQNDAVPDVPKSHDLYWGSFSSAFQNLGQDIGQLVTGRRLDSGSESLGERVRLGQVAAGVEASIEWLSEPRDRKPEMILPMQALSTGDLSRGNKRALPEPITLMFQVDAQGNVTHVTPMVAQSSEAVDSAARTLERYKFRPLPKEELQREQTGTLTLESARP